MHVQLLLTGNELMSGDTIDSNSAMIADRLAALGIAIRRKVTVGDDTAQLDRDIRDILAAGCDLLIINGGLGPTVDDLTAEVLAGVMGQPLEEHAGALAHLHEWCGRRGIPINAANRKQAQLPRGCDMVPNPVGSAVGFRAQLGATLVICTPGVPGELRRMLDAEIVPLVEQRFAGIQPTRITRLRLFGIGESALQQQISDRFPDWPAALELGFRAHLPLVELKLTSRRREDDVLREDWRRKLHAEFGDYIIGENEQTLPGAVVDLLTTHGRTLASAESCTGGLIASQLTSVPGASAVFHAGFVTYSNAIKQKVLGVSADTLALHGAVSEQVVLQMADGALAASGADLAVAVSGIAGPDGGSDDKPVGTVWLAWGGRGALQTRRLFFPTGRAIFQTLVTATALDLVRRQVAGIPQIPRYFTDRKPPDETARG